MTLLTIRRRGRSDRRAFSMIEVVVVLLVMSVAIGIFASTVVAGAQQRAVNREKALAADAARAMIERLHNEKFGQVFPLYNGLAEDDPGGAGTAPGHRFEVLGLTALTSAADGLQGEVIFPTVEQAEAVGVKPVGPQTLTDEQMDGVAVSGGDGGMGGISLGGGGPGGQLGVNLGGGGGNIQVEDGGTADGMTLVKVREEPPPPSDPGWILREDVDFPALGMPRDLNGDNIVDDEDHRGDYVLLPVCIRIRWNGRAGEREFTLTTMLTDFTQ